MSHSADFDFCVLGAGLAGLSVCKHLMEHGASVCLVDVDDVASGASGTPLGLVNPATGRFGNKTWRAEECYQSIYRDLKELQSQTPIRLFDKTGILRPAQDAEMAQRMHENVLLGDWPEGWCSWLSEQEVLAMNPELNCVNGAMWLPKGLTVNVPNYLKAKAKYWNEKGLEIITHADYVLERKKDVFELNFVDRSPIIASSVVYATGFQVKESPHWDFLKLHAIKGQVAIFESEKVNQFKYSISALGYIASISNKRFVAGSTYEHNFDTLEPDNEGLNYLTSRLGGVYPSLFEDANLMEQWAGVRASTPNRKPIIGAHPEIQNMYVFTGLGSKGLLYSAYLGKALSDYILKGSAIPKEVSVNRF